MNNKKALLYNDSLEKFIAGVNISPEVKRLLKLKLPYLDLEGRAKLFQTLAEIYLLDIREKKELERIDEFWQE